MSPQNADCTVPLVCAGDKLNLGGHCSEQDLWLHVCIYPQISLSTALLSCFHTAVLFTSFVTPLLVRRRIWVSQIQKYEFSVMLKNSIIVLSGMFCYGSGHPLMWELYEADKILILEKYSVFSCVNVMKLPIPVAARSKTSACGPSLVGTAGLNPTGVWIFVFCKCCSSFR